jgi:isocitrate dehydrogenase
VTCFTKDNIMKMTDGLFHKTFDEVGAEYPDIEKEHWIVDIGAAKMADTPEAFDVIVMPNLYGDILSDVAAQIAGSVGLAGSANVGTGAAMFEAIHGSAPRRAGQNLANPSGLLLGAVLMLVHIGQPDVAELVHNAWLKTIEDGIHTYDIFREETSKQKVGTKEFAQAVAERVGQKPQNLKPVQYAAAAEPPKAVNLRPKEPSELVGIDVYVEWPTGDPNSLGTEMVKANGGGLELTMMSNRGVKVWPGGMEETFCTDSFRCRFQGEGVSHAMILDLLGRVNGLGIEVVKTEYLRMYGGQPGFSLAQGQ